LKQNQNPAQLPRNFGLRDAQEKDHAETNPTFDFGDTAHKLTSLTSLALGTHITFDKVHIEGIESITQADIVAWGLTPCSSTGRAPPYGFGPLDG
jgi:homoserine dehydrogenase